MKRRVIGLFVAGFVCLLPVAARAQPPCSLHTIAGSYAVQVTGSSMIGSIVPSGSPYQVHGGEATFVARLTIAADGSVAGPLWGVYIAEPVEIPFSAQASVNADCTGELVMPDESFKFVVLANGKEIRMTPWDGFGGSMMTWHRITAADELAPACAQSLLKGNYMMRCEGFELTGEGAAIASSWSLFTFTAADGKMTGKMFTKRFGIPVSTQEEMAFTGTYMLNGDCTVSKEFTFDLLPGLTYKARGVTFDQGKQEFGLPLGIYAGDVRVAPVLPLTCVATRMGQ